MGALAVLITAATMVATGSFPAAAFRQAHNSQFHQNPYGFVQCDTGFTGSTSFLKTGGKQPDGTFPAESYPVTVPPAARCQITAGWWTIDKAGRAVWNQAGYAEFDT